MNKKDLIKNLRKVNPLRSVASCNKESKRFLQDLYNEGKQLNVFTLRGAQ